MQFIQINTHYSRCQVCVYVCVCTLSPRCTWAIKGISKWADYNDAEVCQHTFTYIRTHTHTVYLLDCRRLLFKLKCIIIATHTFLCTAAILPQLLNACFFSVRSSPSWRRRRKNDSVTNANRHWPEAFSYWWWTVRSRHSYCSFCYSFEYNIPIPFIQLKLYKTFWQ